MKKNIILLALMSMFLSFGGQTEIQAQGRQNEKKYWKQIEKAEKERSKYIKKQNKERDKYFRDLRKQEEKYYKEALKQRRNYHKALRRKGPPPWAKAYGYDARNHIYFADYRTFYDPYRGGYVYIEGGNWRFSVDIPSFLVNINLGNARTRVLRDIPLNRSPEDFYDDYYDDYWD